jgi:two-component system response regulator CpxR
MRPKKTILCVDDNETALSVRTFLLETRGYRVIATTQPQEALDHVAQAVPGTIDLLLCDLLMPGMDGNELVRRAKEMHPGLPAMIVSGTVTAHDRAGRADAFLAKGANSAAELLERIRILVARKRGPKKAVPPFVPAPQPQYQGTPTPEPSIPMSVQSVQPPPESRAASAPAARAS